MYWSKHFKMAVRILLLNKMRSFLTMLGVIIGVAAVIVLVFIGRGATENVTNQIKSLGSNLLAINIMNRGKALTYQEAMDFKQIPYISGISPVVSANATIKYGTKDDQIQVLGINSEYKDVRNADVSQGRFFTSLDIDLRNKVAILGSSVAQEFFGYLNPIGEEIRINGQNFTVIGVMQSRGSSIGGSEDEQVFIPVTVAERLFKSRGVRTIYVQAKTPQDVSYALNELSARLSKIYKGDTESFRVFDQTQVLETVQKVSNSLSLMLGGIAAISLLVGGIGIMNIMIISVMERTKEIGIRRALGAKKNDILSQFLIESAIISIIGGILGVVLAFIIAFALNKFFSISIKVSMDIVFVALGLSAVLGVFFGLYPANKAAKLSPAVALQYE